MALTDEQQQDVWEWIAAMVDPATPATGRQSDRFHFPPPFKTVLSAVESLRAEVTALREQISNMPQTNGGTIDGSYQITKLAP